MIKMPRTMPSSSVRPLSVGACVAALFLAAAPLAATAQTTPEAPSAKNLKGSPNANGYGKHEPGSLSASDAETTGQAPSAQGMKGSPNANGYQKK